MALRLARLRLGFIVTKGRDLLSLRGTHLATKIGWRTMAAAHGNEAPSEGENSYAQQTPTAQLYGVSKTKDYKSAIVVIPPTELWRPIQTVRSIHDKNYHRWMPHVNLMYPFLPDEGSCFEDVAAQLRERLKNIEPFRVHLDEIQSFTHKKSATVWLGPQEDIQLKILKELNQRLEAVFPEHNDVSTISDKGFTPHLSLGQVPPQSSNKAMSTISDFLGSEFPLGSGASVDVPPQVCLGKKQDKATPKYTEESEQRLRRLESSNEVAENQPAEGETAWNRLSFIVDHVHVISRRNYHDPFHIRVSIPLGSTNDKHLRDSEYQSIVWNSQAETSNPVPGETRHASSTSNTERADGEESTRPHSSTLYFPTFDGEGYWNFAFGANMSRNKVENSRKIRPLESVPGKLPGWRLSFSHRGGMGTIVPASQEAALKWMEQTLRCDFGLRGVSLPEDLLQEYFTWGSDAPNNVSQRLLECFPGSTDATVNELLKQASSVHGVLHKLSEDAYTQLRRSENGYNEFELEVEAYDGRIITAKTFVSRPGQELPHGSLRPTQRYLDMLTSGHKDYGVDEEYISWVRKFPTVQPKERTSEYYSNPDGPPPKLPNWRPGESAIKHEAHPKSKEKRTPRYNKRGRVQHL